MEKDEEEEEEIVNEEKEEKKPLFSFAKINKYFIFPFLSPVFCFLANFFIGLISSQEGVNHFDFLMSLVISLSYVGGGLLYFISWIRTNTEKTRVNPVFTKERTSSSIRLIYNYQEKSEKRKNAKIFGILLLMSIMIAANTEVSVFCEGKYVFEERLYYLFFMPIFSKYILKINIFSHQILSLLIAFVGLILLFIPIILVIRKEDIIINIIFLITSIGFSLMLVLCKYLTQIYFMSPYLCILYLGLMTTIITVLYYMVTSLIQYGDFSIITNSFNFNDVKTSKLALGLYILGCFTCASFLQTLTILVIYYFSPTLFIVTDIISPLLAWIVTSVEKGEKKRNIVFNSLGYLIVFVSSLIYNEIIVCNFWGLNLNTRRYIEERQKHELVSISRSADNIQNISSEHLDSNGSYEKDNDN